MSGSNGARVSIGLPVYNGERYLAATLDSLLTQTYSDLELVISDNASTDATEEICRAYAGRDARVRYYRNATNLGAAPNYNRVFRLASGEYFKWAAHDDLCAPEYLEACVRVLDETPHAVVCHTRTAIIDEHGDLTGHYDDELDLREPRPSDRFARYLFRRASEWNAIFGVVRRSVLAETPLIGGYIGSDQVLLGELVLRGAVYELPERLFFRRDHPDNSWRAHRSVRALTAWFDPTVARGPQVPTTLRHLGGYLGAIGRVPLPAAERVRCAAFTAKWLAKRVAWPVQRRWRAARGAWRAGDARGG